MPSVMDRAALDRALRAAATTRVLVLEPNLTARVGEIIKEHAPGRPVVLIADEVTWPLAGAAIEASLAAAGVPISGAVRLHGGVTPDRARVAGLRAVIEAGGRDALPLTIGSGTINDLTKRAAWESDVSYAVLATAASMDGYTASGAALVDAGVKQTFACDAPLLVLADRAIIAHAPAAMTAAGYGDLLGKVTAGADWLVADALGIDPIVPTAWDAVQGPLRGILADPARYASGDPDAIEELFLALAVSGLAIQATGSSRPASGSEHQFSHYWEMRGLEQGGIPVSHGFKVGLGSLVATALYERLLQRDLDQIDILAVLRGRPSWDETAATIRDLHAIPAIRDKALAEMRVKYVPDDDLAARLERLQAAWPALRDRLTTQLIPASDLAAMLAAAGAPTTPGAIGLSRHDLRLSYAAATHIRQRYTVFDLAHDTGLFNDLVADLFTPGGYWHDHS